MPLYMKLFGHYFQSHTVKETGQILNCPILCGQYKKEPLVGKIEF